MPDYWFDSVEGNVKRSLKSEVAGALIDLALFIRNWHCPTDDYCCILSLAKNEIIKKEIQKQIDQSTDELTIEAVSDLYSIKAKRTADNPI